MRQLAAIALLVSALTLPARGDLDTGRLGKADGPPAEELRGLMVARDRPAVAIVWSEHRVWLTRNWGVSWSVQELVGAPALTRDGRLVIGPDDGSDHWRARVAAATADVGPALSNDDEWGDIVIEDGHSQRLWGDPCPCEGGGQERFVDGKRDEKFNDDYCPHGYGVGARGWAYWEPECHGPSTIVARGPRGEEVVHDLGGECRVDTNFLVATDGHETYALGRALWKLDGPRIKKIGASLVGATQLAASGDTLWAVRNGAVWCWRPSLGWRPVAPLGPTGAATTTAAAAP
jgi:hypothetical protein